MLSKEIQSELTQSILEVFPKIPPPTYEELTSHKCYECDGVKDDFNGVEWWNAEYQLISENFGKLPLFTLAAYHYYFPAYLICSLDESNPSFHTTIRDFIIHGLSPSKTNIDFSIKRRDVFTDEQKAVIVNYLGSFLKDEDADYLFEDIENALVFLKQ